MTPTIESTCAPAVIGLGGPQKQIGFIVNVLMLGSFYLAKVSKHDYLGMATWRVKLIHIDYRVSFPCFLCYE